MLKRGLRKHMSCFMSLIYPDHAEGLICTGCPQFSLYKAAMKLSKFNFSGYFYWLSNV